MPPRAEEFGAIVVLGCAIRDGRPSSALARRIELGVRAHEEIRCAPIVASGGKRWSRHVECEVIRDILLTRAPAAEVLLEAQSQSTFENAHFTAALLAKLGVRRVMIATCGWHLPRAITNFRRCGLDAVGPPPAWIESPRPSLGRRVREQVSAWLDARQLARMRELE